METRPQRKYSEYTTQLKKFKKKGVIIGISGLPECEIFDQSVPEGSLTIITVAGLPGIGKSTLFSNMIEYWTKVHNCKVKKVESDTVRQEAIKLEREKPESVGLLPYELEMNSKEVFTKMLHQEITDVIADLVKLEGKSIFILDKNYVPEELREVIYSVARKKFTVIRSFLILPLQSYDEELRMELEGKKSPFYKDILCASLIRCFKRKGHISLSHGYTHSVKSVVGTLRSYLGQSFEDIAEKYGMEILYYDYFNAIKMKEEPLRSILVEKIEPVFEMISKVDYDGDKIAEILLSAEGLVENVMTYDNHEEQFLNICKKVAGIEDETEGEIVEEDEENQE